MSRPAYVRATTVEEAVAAAGAEGAVLLAGGTDLMNDLRLGQRRPAVVVDIAGVGELRRLEVGDPGGAGAESPIAGGRSGGGLSAGGRIGGGVTLARLLDELSPRRLPAVTDAAVLFGGRQIRAAATVGGNLCSASPAAELATPLLAYDAAVEVVGPDGGRRVPLAEFWLGPRRPALGPAEVLQAVLLPDGLDASASAYGRVELRRSVDIALVSVSVRLDVADGEVTAVRVAVGAAAPTPFRAEAAEALLVGLPVAGGGTDGRVAEAGRAVAAAARPIDDVRASAGYRRAMLEVVTTRVVARALARAGGPS